MLIVVILKSCILGHIFESYIEKDKIVYNVFIHNVIIIKEASRYKHKQMQVINILFTLCERKSYYFYS